jgi:hypothetical protein
MGFKDFREIAAWRLSRDVRSLAYELLKRPDVSRDFKYRDQLIDAARSAPRKHRGGLRPLQTQGIRAVRSRR